MFKFNKKVLILKHLLIIKKEYLVIKMYITFNYRYSQVILIK